MALKRKGEPAKQPKKRGVGRTPTAAQAAKAASASGEEAEHDVHEEPEESLDVVAQVCDRQGLCYYSVFPAFSTCAVSNATHQS